MIEVEGLRKTITAADVLRKYQKQLDPDGIEVGVSRQALDEVLNELEAAEKKYNELIMAVAQKFPNESRHETALRYINQREARVGIDAAKEIKQREKDK